MELAKYKACICEGSAENAIMDILLDNDLLIFTREEIYRWRTRMFEKLFQRKKVNIDKLLQCGFEAEAGSVPTEEICTRIDKNYKLAKKK